MTMKYTLKNRPRPHAWVENMKQRYEEWFKGFEAELRKKEKQMQQADYPSDFGERKLIKEILGK